MRAINCIFQNLDFSEEKIGETTLEKAVNLFKTFPWDMRLQTYKEMEVAGKDVCPPSICFTDNTHYLTIWADTNHKYGVMVSVPVKLLFISSKKNLDFVPAQESDIAALLKMYFEGDFAAIKNYK